MPSLLIFHGPEGVGKWSAAEAFIQQKMCEVGAGCGVCSACRKLERNDHPDFIRFPEERVLIGDMENPEPFTVRWLLKTRVNYTPFEGKIRFVLIPRADLIQHEAETALLKTLEEPPDHTRFIFIVRDLSELKETIVSRGVGIPFMRLSEHVMQDLVGEMDAGMRHLLGGSLHLYPLLHTPLYEELRNRIDNAVEHPINLLRLESWLKEQESGRFAGLVNDLAPGYEDALDFFGLLLIHKIWNTDEFSRKQIQQIIPYIYDFKERLHREQSGMNGYILSRLFHKLETTMFEKEPTMSFKS